MNWTVILSVFGGSTAFFGAAAWLVKSLVSHFLKKDVEAYKVQLKAQSDVEIEKLKSQLQITATERNVRFSHVFEKTAETIVKTYQLLQEVLKAVQNYTDAVEVRSAPGDLEAAREQFNQSAQEFFTYFHANKIYIPKKKTPNAFSDY